MNILPAVPQPRPCLGYWLWLNFLYTSAEISERFAYHNGTWYELGEVVTQ